MAEDLYKNMSVDELGSSLLSKKADSDRAKAKKNKKNERVQQGLALLLMGQGVMKSQYKKRAAELTENYTFDKIGADVKSQHIAANSSIINTMGIDWDGKGGVEGFKASDDYSNFSMKLKPILDGHFRTVLGEEFEGAYNTGTYNNAIDASVEAYANHYIGKEEGSKVPRYVAYENSLKELFGGKEPADMDRLEVLRLGMGINENTLNMYQRQNYKQVLGEYRSQGNLMGGFKRVLNMFSDKSVANGGPDLMTTVDENILAGGTIADMSRSLDLKSLTNSIADREFAKAAKLPERWLEIAMSKSQNGYTKRILEMHLPAMRSLVKSGRFPSSLEQSVDTQITSGDYEDFVTDLLRPDKTADRVAFINHSAALSLKMERDSSFLKGVWKSTSSKDMSYPEFKTIMAEEENRTYFAMMQMLGEGFVDSKYTGFRAKNKKGYQSFGTLKTVFDKFSGVTDWVNDGLLINKGTLDIGKSFPTYPVEKKKEEIEKTIDMILTQNANKPQQLDSLLNQINPLVQNVFKVDVTDYVEDFVRERMVELEKAKPGYVEFDEPRSFIESTINGNSYFSTRIEDKENPDTDSKKKIKINPLLIKQKEVGKDLAIEAINLVTGLGKNESPEYIASIKSFLTSIVNNESDFGTHKNTFNNPLSNAKGPWQIKDGLIGDSANKIGFYGDVVDVLSRETGRGKSVRAYNEQLKNTLGIDLANAKPEDLNTMLYGAAFARAGLLLVEASIPEDPKEKAYYYADHYHKGKNRDKVARAYLLKNKEFFALSSTYIDSMKSGVKNILDRND